MNVGKIEVETILLLVKFLACIDDSRFELRLPRKEIHHIDNVFHTVNVEIVHHGSFAHYSDRKSVV